MENLSHKTAGKLLLIYPIGHGTVAAKEAGQCDQLRDMYLPFWLRLIMFHPLGPSTLLPTQNQDSVHTGEELATKRVCHRF